MRVLSGMVALVSAAPGLHARVVTQRRPPYDRSRSDPRRKGSDMESSTVAGAAAPRVVAPSFLERWAPAAGTLFAALFVVAVVIGFAGLDTGNKLPEVTQNFASEDYQSTGGFVFILILLSALCFLWFLADLTAPI